MKEVPPLSEISNLRMSLLCDQNTVDALTGRLAELPQEQDA